MGQRINIKLVAGLLFIVIACAIVALLGYQTFEGFSEGARTRQKRVENASQKVSAGPSTATTHNKQNKVRFSATQQ